MTIVARAGYIANIDACPKLDIYVSMNCRQYGLNHVYVWPAENKSSILANNYQENYDALENLLSL